MENVRPIYKKILLIVIAIYIIGTTFMISDIYHKVGKIEDALTEDSHHH